MIIQLKKDSYDLPKGRFRAFLREAFSIDREDTGKGDKGLRLVFQVTSLTAKRKRYLAGKSYYLADITKLAYDLESWLGNELDMLVDSNGALSIERLQGLKGREAVIDVVHIDNKRELAFRHIRKILPAGTPVDDDEVSVAA